MVGDGRQPQAWVQVLCPLRKKGSLSWPQGRAWELSEFAEGPGCWVAVRPQLVPHFSDVT